MDHPFHKLIRRADLSNDEKIVLTAVVALSTTKKPYVSMTFEEIYDALLVGYEEHFAPRGPA